MSIENSFEALRIDERSKIANDVCHLLLKWGAFVEKGQFSIAVDSTELARLLKAWKDLE